jgi:hypothetical protein
MATGYYWILRNWKTDREIGRYNTFDEAMAALAERSGQWSANWTLQEICKGDYRLTSIRI